MGKKLKIKSKVKKKKKESLKMNVLTEKKECYKTKQTKPKIKPNSVIDKKHSEMFLVISVMVSYLISAYKP